MTERKRFEHQLRGLLPSEERCVGRMDWVAIDSGVSIGFYPQVSEEFLNAQSD